MPKGYRATFREQQFKKDLLVVPHLLPKGAEVHLKQQNSQSTFSGYRAQREAGAREAMEKPLFILPLLQLQNNSKLVI